MPAAHHVKLPLPKCPADVCICRSAIGQRKRDAEAEAAGGDKEQQQQQKKKKRRRDSDDEYQGENGDWGGVGGA